MSFRSGMTRARPPTYRVDVDVELIIAKIMSRASDQRFIRCLSQYLEDYEVAECACQQGAEGWATLPFKKQEMPVPPLRVPLGLSPKLAEEHTATVCPIERGVSDHSEAASSSTSASSNELSADASLLIEGGAKQGETATLIKALTSANAAGKQLAAAALGTLAVDNHDNAVAIAAAGAIEPLVALARGGTDGQKEEAAAALATLAVDKDNAVAIATAGAIEPLVALARSGTDGQKEEAAAALAIIAAKNAGNAVAIATAGAIEPLVALARGGTDGQKEEAAAALRTLAVNVDHAVWQGRGLCRKELLQESVQAKGL